jgi:hypothetical protein
MKCRMQPMMSPPPPAVIRLQEQATGHVGGDVIHRGSTTPRTSRACLPATRSKQPGTPPHPAPANDGPTTTPLPNRSRSVIGKVS